METEEQSQPNYATWTEYTHAHKFQKSHQSNYQSHRKSNFLPMQTFSQPISLTQSFNNEPFLLLTQSFNQQILLNLYSIIQLSNPSYVLLNPF